MQPLPPSPAFTRILASSINMMCNRENFAATKKPRLEAEADKCPVKTRLAASPTTSTKTGQALSLQQDLLRFYGLRLDHHKFPHRSLVEELDAPRDLGEESVVFAASNVQPGL